MDTVFYTKSRLPWKAIVLAGLLAVGCRSGPTNLGIADRCTESRQCRSGICLFPTKGSEDGLCTKPCTGNSDCLEGWSCTALTQDGVMVCQKGQATPFGF
jgi:hypothetical protein